MKSKKIHVAIGNVVYEKEGLVRDEEIPICELLHSYKYGNDKVYTNFNFDSYGMF